MRSRPRFIRVLGQRIIVIPVKGLTHTDEASEDSHEHRAYGVFDPAIPEIALDADSGSERTKVTLVHEALHAMLNTAKIDEVEDEEDLVGRLAPVLLDFLRANHSAVLYLQES